MMRSSHYERHRHPQHTRSGRFLQLVFRLSSSVGAQGHHRVLALWLAACNPARRDNLIFPSAVQGFVDGAIVRSELVRSAEI